MSAGVKTVSTRDEVRGAEIFAEWAKIGKRRPGSTGHMRSWGSNPLGRNLRFRGLSEGQNSSEKPLFLAEASLNEVLDFGDDLIGVSTLGDDVQLRALACRQHH